MWRKSWDGPFGSSGLIWITARPPMRSRALAGLGVDFRFRTAVTAVGEGHVDTTRGPITRGSVVVAVNHDIDQLLPDVAERHGVVRCALDMMRAAVSFRHPLAAPLLTGWSLVRYGRFADGPEAGPCASACTPSAPTSPRSTSTRGTRSFPTGRSSSATRTPPPRPRRRSSPRLRSPPSSRRPALFDAPAPRVIERWQGVREGAAGIPDRSWRRRRAGARRDHRHRDDHGPGTCRRELAAAFGWAAAMEGTS